MREDRWLAYAQQFMELLKPISERMRKDSDLEKRVQKIEEFITTLKEAARTEWCGRQDDFGNKCTCNQDSCPRSESEFYPGFDYKLAARRTKGGCK